MHIYEIVKNVLNKNSITKTCLYNVLYILEILSHKLYTSSSVALFNTTEHASLMPVIMTVIGVATNSL